MIVKLKKLHVSFLLPFFLLISTAELLAFNYHRIKDTYSLEAQETLEGVNLIIADNLDVAGEVSNDLFCYARGSPFKSASDSGKVFLQGIFKNDIWALGQQIKFTGTAANHVNLIANSVTFSGTASNNVSLLANNVHVTQEAVLRADAFIAGGNIICEGRLQKPTKIIGRAVTLSGHFESNLEVKAQELIILSGTTFAEDFHYSTPKNVTFPKNVTIQGEAKWHKPLAKSSEKNLSARLAFTLFNILTLFCVGFLFIAAFPKTTWRASLIVRQFPGRSFLTSVIVLFSTPLVIVILAVSVIGIPVALLLVALFFLAVYIGKVILALTLGSVLLPALKETTRMRMAGRLALGGLIFLVVSLFVPELPLTILSALFALGALVRAIIFRSAFSQDQP